MAPPARGRQGGISAGGGQPDPDAKDSLTLGPRRLFGGPSVSLFLSVPGASGICGAAVGEAVLSAVLQCVQGPSDHHLWGEEPSPSSQGSQPPNTQWERQGGGVELASLPTSHTYQLCASGQITELRLAIEFREPTTHQGLAVLAVLKACLP